MFEHGTDVCGKVLGRARPFAAGVYINYGLIEINGDKVDLYCLCFGMGGCVVFGVLGARMRGER